MCHGYIPVDTCHVFSSHDLLFLMSELCRQNPEFAQSECACSRIKLASRPPSIDDVDYIFIDDTGGRYPSESLCVKSIGNVC